MSVRSSVSRSAVAAAVAVLLLMAPAAPAAAADPLDKLANLRVTLAQFTAEAELRNPANGPTVFNAENTLCTVTGLRGLSPFAVGCTFTIPDTTADISRRCTGTFNHLSIISFFDPFTGESTDLVYQTRTALVEGEGSGVGVNEALRGKLHFTVVSLCAIAEQQPAGGNLAGYASAV